MALGEDIDTATAADELDPEEAARRTFTAHRDDSEWLDAFIASLDRHRAVDAFSRTTETWGLSQAEAARLFGVSRQAIGKWMRRGVPSDRAGAVADLAAATDLLVHYLKRDRIPAVVRRPIPTLGGISLMGLLEQGNTQSLLTACRKMFQFERAHA